jgi:SagB-type dehydrogenase family enzyme
MERFAVRSSLPETEGMRSQVGALEIHALTSYARGIGYPDDPRKLKDWAGPMREPRPPQFKTYASGEVRELPREIVRSEVPVGDALGPPSSSSRTPDLRVLGTVLFLSAGVVRSRDFAGVTEHYRAAGSSGNRFPLELYVAIGESGELDPGLYHYGALEHALRRIADGDVRAIIASALAVEAPASAYIVVTGVPWRAGWRYEERAFRNLYRDAGTMLSQLVAVAGAHGLGPRAHLGFVDRAIDELLGVDRADEFSLAVVGIGSHVRASQLTHGRAARGDVGARKRFQLVTAAQRAGDLADAAAVKRWRAAVGDPARDARPALGTGSISIEEAILRRGSARQFQCGPAPATFADALAFAAHGVEIDGANGAALWHYAIVHDVDGRSPGAYAIREEELAPIRADTASRQAATALCLDQPLGGEGAIAIFHCAPVADLVRSAGERIYRLALVEAGAVSGRIHLLAQAYGLGATGLTFYDDEVRRYFDTPADPLLVTSVGVPAYRARRGGSPGRPNMLRAARA